MVDFGGLKQQKNKIQFKEMGISPAKMVDFAGFNGLTFKNQDSTSQSFWDVMTCDSSVGSAIDKHGVLLFIYIYIPRIPIKYPVKCRILFDPLRSETGQGFRWGPKR